MTKDKKAWMLAVVAALTASAAVASPAFDETNLSASSVWVPTKPGATPPEEDLFGRERKAFREQMNNGIFEQLCQVLDIAGGQTLNGGDYVHFSAKIKRSIRRTAENKLALVDEIPLSLNLGYSYAQKIVSGDNLNAGVSFRIGGLIEGESLVVRPMPAGVNSCKLLLKMINPLSLKTAFPINAKRLSEMQVGELWKLPFRLQVPVAPYVGVGGSVSIPTSYVTIVLHGGRFDDRSRTLTVYRVSEDQLRLRLRFDQATVVEAGGLVRGTYSLDDTGLDMISDLAPLIGPEVAREIFSTLGASLGYNFADRSKGRRTFREFMLNPKDPAQMEALAKLMLSDINIVARFLKEGKDNIAEQHAAKLDEKAMYTSVDHYESSMHHVPLHLPVLMKFDAIKAENSDTVDASAEKGAMVTVLGGLNQKNRSMIDVPFLGYLTKKDTWNNAQVFVDRTKDGNISLSMLYTQLDGYKSQPAATPREIAGQLNDVAKYVGARGQGTNPSTGLPLDAIFPEGTATGRTGSKRGNSAFALVLSERAIGSILAAKPEQVAGAYLNSLDDSDKGFARAVFGDKPTLDNKGRLVFDASAAAAYGGEASKPNERVTRVQRAQALAETARGVLKDHAAAAQAADPDARAAALRKALNGKGESGLATREALKVYLQYADPKDVAAQLELSAKAGGAIQAHYWFNQSLPEVRRVSELKRRKDRHDTPTELQD